MKAPSAHTQRAWAGGLIVVATLAAYHNSFWGAFVFDDAASIADNSTIRHFGSAFSPPAGGVTVEGRPLLNLALALNYAISGTRTWSYHALNLIVHGLAGLTLFGILSRTLAHAGFARPGSPARGADAPGLSPPILFAFAVALLWTVHPLQTESVTYIVQRAESLMGLFYFLTLYFFVRSAEGDAAGLRPLNASRDAANSAPAPHAEPNLAGRRELSLFYSFLAVLACVLGMATKEVMATAPLMVFLFDRTFISGSFGEAWRTRRGFYLCLAATWIPLAVFVARTGGNRSGTSGFALDVTATSYWLTQLPAVWTYLRLAVWPHPLVIDYGAYGIQDLSALLAGAISVGLILAGIALSNPRSIARPRPDSGSLHPEFAPGRGALGFAGIWFLAILAPTSVIPGARQAMAEHRMYLPLASVVVGIVAVLWKTLGSRPLRFLCAVLTLGAALGIVTVARNAAYGDPTALWTEIIAAQPNNAFAHDDLGSAWLNLGRVEDAKSEYQAAVRLEPGYAQAYYNLGNALEQLHQLPEAADRFKQALSLSPNLRQAHSKLGNVLMKLGRNEEAIAEFKAAVAAAPNSADDHDNLAVALAEAGRRPEAEQQFAQALALDAKSPLVRYNWGNYLVRTARLNAAIAQYQEALRLNPDYVAARANLAITFAQAGRIEDSIVEFRQALQREPNSAQLHFNLGNALLQSNRLKEAQIEFHEALRLAPGNPAARNNAERIDALLSSPR